MLITASILRVRIAQVPLTYLSLFSGCGGFDLGFNTQGFTSVGAYDINPKALGVLRHNLGAPAIVCDLSNGLPAKTAQIPDVIIAGSPCQGFSTLGRRDLHDPRNHLLLTSGRIAVEVRPKLFIAENVVGVTSGSHRQYWHGLRDLLRSHGYQTAELKVRATELGVPQLRQRVLMIAWSGDTLWAPTLPNEPQQVIGDVLKGLKDLPNHEPTFLLPGSDREKIARRIKSGQKLSNVRSGPRAVHTWEIPEVYGRTTARERKILMALMVERRRHRVRDRGDADPVSLGRLRKALGSFAAHSLSTLLAKGFVRRVGRCYDLTHTFNGKYRRLSWHEPSPTVDTKFGDPRLFLHPSESRGFTVREAARIQGFPDDFLFTGSFREQLEMVGNAVPPPMGAAVARLARAFMELGCGVDDPGI